MCVFGSNKTTWIGCFKDVWFWRLFCGFLVVNFGVGFHDSLLWRLRIVFFESVVQPASKGKNDVVGKHRFHKVLSLISMQRRLENLTIDYHRFRSCFSHAKDGPQKSLVSKRMKYEMPYMILLDKNPSSLKMMNIQQDQLLNSRWKFHETPMNISNTICPVVNHLICRCCPSKKHTQKE